MSHHSIIIKDIEPSTHDLILSDHGHTNAHHSDSVRWHIGNKSGVHSISSIIKKSDSPEIFSTQPSETNNWRGVINSTASTTEVYKYSIWWIANDGSGPYEYDPKIAVNPRTYLVFKKKFILFLLVLSALFSLLFLLKNKK